MNITMYVFMALVLLLINEYRLIKKYIRAINQQNEAVEKTTLQKIIFLLIKPFTEFKNWVDAKLLNNDLNY
jgi:hypothetical protein